MKSRMMRRLIEAAMKYWRERERMGGGGAGVMEIS